MTRTQSNTSPESLRFSSLPSRQAPKLLPRKRRQGGFTLIELILVLGVISAITGVLVPAVQKNRAIFFTKGTSNTIMFLERNAEKTYYQANHRYSASFEDLGISQLFPCDDPACTHRQNSGYFHQITVSPSGQEFTATATPAVLGKTGSAKCVIDQTTDHPTCAPIPEAEAVRQQMFANIRAQAIQTMFQLLLERTPSEVPEIARGLESPDTFRTVFRQLDADGDGKVTFQEILNYQGLGSDVMGDFVQSLGQELELGAGGENVDALPGITLADLQVQGPNPYVSMIQGNLVGLWQSPPAGDNARPVGEARAVRALGLDASAISLPAVQISGFCDGSAQVFWQPGQQVTLPFTDATFLARLDPDDPDNTTGAAGTFTLSDQHGNLIDGILIGLLQPATGGGVSLQSLIIGTESEGQWWSPSLGNGGASIFLGNDTRSSFNGQFQMLPAVQR